MRIFPKQLPGRRLELGLTALLIAGLLVLIWLNREDSTAGPMLVLTIWELLLPLVLGAVAAGLLADDPALDLLLSVPQPAPCILAERIAIVLGYGLVLGLGMQYLAAKWKIPLPIQGVKQALIWTVPSVFLMGIATTASLVRGRAMDGLTAVLGTWAAMLLTIPFIGQACALTPGDQPCRVALLSPALTLIRPTDANWSLNRLIWLSLGILLLGIGLLLACDEERLVEASRAE